MNETENENENEVVAPVKKRKRRVDVITVILIVLCLILVALLIFIFNFSLNIVDGESMTNTLVDQQYVLTNKSDNPTNGDIIVFTKDGKTYIKRVVAVGGQSIQFVKVENGYKTQVTNGDGEFVDVDESYIKEPMLTLNRKRPNTPYEIGEGEFFVMGDNRNNSEDSRGDIVGLVSKEHIDGVVVYIAPPGGAGEFFLKIIFWAALLKAQA